MHDRADRVRVSLPVLLFLTIMPAAMMSAQPNPVPQIAEPLVPAAALPGGAGFTLTVNGTGFVPGSVVNWNGGARSTSFVRGTTEVTATILASDIATAATASVTVFNPGPGGGTSNPVFFPITNPTSSVTLGRSDLSLPSLLLPTITGDWMITGDFNADGKLDLAILTVVPGLPNGSVAILLGNGDGTFSAPSVTGDMECGPQGGCTVTSLAAGDFNGDGKLDLAVTSYGDNTVKILLGNGNGGFSETAHYLVGNIPRSVAVGDFNLDGKLDLAVANEGSNSVSVLLGNGDGTFQQAVSYGAGPGADPLWVAVGDFNGDGKPDLVTANPGIATVSVLLGNGDGTFQAPATYPTGAGDSAVVPADLNGDGKLDLITTNGQPNSVSVLLGNGDGTFQSHVDYATGSSPLSLVAGDFNGDGKLDLVVANECSPPPPGCNFPGSVSILLGNGDGAFQPHVDYPSGQSSVSVAAGDFNGDGRLDLATVGGNSPTPLSVFLQIPAASLSPTSLSFVNESVNTTSAPQTATLTNTGSAPLTPVITVTGTNSGDFAQSNNCGSSVAGENSCTISVTFTPTATGTRTANLTITDNAAGSPQTVSLTGMGIAPTATVTPGTLSFAGEPLGVTSAPKKVTITNSSTNSAVLVFTNFSISGDFAISSNGCNGVQLAQGTKCTVSVTFTPTGYGKRTGKLTITDNATNSPQTVSFTGSGPDFTISASPTSLTVTRGQSGTSTLTLTPKNGFNQTVVLTCSGAPKNSTCSIAPSSVTLDGTNAQTATLTISTTSSTPTGTFNLLAKGTFSTLAHSAKITLTVQ